MNREEVVVFCCFCLLMSINFYSCTYEVYEIYEVPVLRSTCTRYIFYRANVHCQDPNMCIMDNGGCQLHMEMNVHVHVHFLTATVKPYMVGK